MQTDHVRNRHGSVEDGGASNASSNTRVQMSLGRGSRSAVLDGWQVCCAGRGRRLLVPKDAEGQLMTIESRQAEARRPLMAVKPSVKHAVWHSQWWDHHHRDAGGRAVRTFQCVTVAVLVHGNSIPEF